MKSRSGGADFMGWVRGGGSSCSPGHELPPIATSPGWSLALLRRPADEARRDRRVAVPFEHSDGREQADRSSLRDHAAGAANAVQRLRSLAVFDPVDDGVQRAVGLWPGAAGTVGDTRREEQPGEV